MFSPDGHYTSRFFHRFASTETTIFKLSMSQSLNISNYCFIDEWSLLILEWHLSKNDKDEVKSFRNNILKFYVTKTIRVVLLMSCFKVVILFHTIEYLVAPQRSTEWLSAK
jgi:hypothetical protein